MRRFYITNFTASPVPSPINYFVGNELGTPERGKNANKIVPCPLILTRARQFGFTDAYGKNRPRGNTSLACIFVFSSCRLTATRYKNKLT